MRQRKPQSGLSGLRCTRCCKPRKLSTRPRCPRPVLRDLTSKFSLAQVFSFSCVIFFELDAQSDRLLCPWSVASGAAGSSSVDDSIKDKEKDKNKDKGPAPMQVDGDEALANAGKDEDKEKQPAKEKDKDKEKETEGEKKEKEKEKGGEKKKGTRANAQAGDRVDDVSGSEFDELEAEPDTDEEDGADGSSAEDSEDEPVSPSTSAQQLRADAKAHEAKVQRSKAARAQRVADARASGRLGPLFDALDESKQAAAAEAKADAKAMAAAMGPVNQLAGSMEGLVRLKSEAAELDLRRKRAETEVAEALAKEAKAKAELSELQLKAAQAAVAAKLAP